MNKSDTVILTDTEENGEQTQKLFVSCLVSYDLDSRLLEKASNILLVIFLILTSMNLSAQNYRINDDRTILGFYADYVFADHKTDFVSLTDCYCFPDNFTKAGGSGFAFGLLYQYPLP